MATPRISPTSGICLLNLPIEIRLEIYSHLFVPSKVILDAGNPPSNQTFLIPTALNTRRHQCGRSSQLLRVCKEILYTARPVLYANTTFHIMMHTFAGTLPSGLSNSHLLARHARHVVWQLDCDILKKYYPEDFAFQQGDLGMLDTLEMIAKVDTWKGSFCGEDTDRDGFVRGRKDMLEYGKLLLSQLQKDAHSPAYLVEDQRYLGQGEVRMRLCRRDESLRPMVS